MNGGRCAAQAEDLGLRRWVQCELVPGHEGIHIWGDDNQVTEAKGFA